MSKCRNCNVQIRDNTDVCPLCHCVLEQDGKGKDTYPDIRFMTRRLLLVCRILLFGIILSGVLLFTINYENYHGTWWCAIVIAALLYLYLILRFAVVDNAGYKAKIIVLTVCGVLFVVLVDFVTGYGGWSVNYVIPGGILLVDVGIVVLMIVNMRNWQSYLLFQIFMILCSLLPVIFWRFDIVTSPVMSLIALGVSSFLFLGTMIIGDRRARIELKRRFHVR